MALLLFALNLLSLYCLIGARKMRLRAPFALLLLPGVVVSFARDGWSWPLVPLWLWSLLIAATLIQAAPARTASHRYVVIACGVSISYCALNLAQQRLTSVELPTLSGPYPVAKHRWVIQSQRSDVHNPDPFAKREFLVNVYYPTQANDALKRAPYLSPAMMAARFFQEQPALTRFFFQRDVLRLQARALEGEFREGEGASLSPAQPKYPVVVFSPGRGWFADLHTFYLEQLASHGYVVFAITHPGGSTALVEYPDGRISRGGWNRHFQEDSAAVAQQRRARLKTMYAAIQNDLKQRQLPSETQLREYAAVESSDRVTPLTVRKEDVIELLDRLQRLNTGDIASEFAGRLDLGNIAVTGMSYGGATASEVCLDDSRCKVVVNLDGEEHGRVSIVPGTRPALWLYDPAHWGADWNWQGDFRRPTAYARYAGPAYRVGFAGADHGAFTDFPFWPHEIEWSDILLPRWLTQHSARNARAALPPLILEYELDFLDHYLKGKPLRLLSCGQTRPGTTVDRRNIDSTTCDAWSPP